MNRRSRAALAAHTDQIVATGSYATAGATVDLSATLAAARQASHLHLPDDHVAAPSGAAERSGRIEVTAETTLAAARRVDAERGATGGEGPTAPRVAVLNFASAKHPGGGYRSGSQAQEESIARSSGLVTCQEQVTGFYDFHRWQSDPVYSHRVICSPGVPVFRDDAGALLDAPYLVDVLTAAAPNAGALRDRRSAVDVGAVLRDRAQRVLAIAASHGTTHLVLGAWGCGVFRNDPAVVAETFRHHLAGGFRGSFDQVTFAIFDPIPGAPVRTTFERLLTH